MEYDEFGDDVHDTHSQDGNQDHDMGKGGSSSAHVSAPPKSYLDTHPRQSMSEKAGYPRQPDIVYTTGAWQDNGGWDQGGAWQKGWGSQQPQSASHTSGYGRKGSKGTPNLPKGQGKGKGKAVSVPQLVTTTQNLLLAVARTQREQLRMCQFVVLFQDSSSAIKDLLFNARTHYNNRRPKDKEAHPDGSIHHVYFCLFNQYCIDHKDLFNGLAAESVLFLFAQLARPPDRNAPSYIHSFTPLGRIRGSPPSVWPWKMQIHAGTTTGLQLQSQFAELSEQSLLNTPQWSIRRDNGKMGPLEEDLSRMRLA
jgi:hypothetical protein